MLGQYDILEGDYVEPSPDELQARDRARQGSEGLLLAIQSTLKTNWPCGCIRTPDNTHTVGGVAQCRTCRRKRWNRAVKLAVLSARQQRWEQHKIDVRKAEAEAQAKLKCRTRAEISIAAAQKHKEMCDAEAAILIRGLGPGRKPLDVIKAIVAAKFGLTVRQLIGNSRKQTNVMARAVIAVVMYERGLSYPRIGALMGGRDHSTIINARKMFPTYCKRDSRVWEAYNAVKDD